MWPKRTARIDPIQQIHRMPRIIEVTARPFVLGAWYPPGGCPP
jgi:hypothetical protein